MTPEDIARDAEIAEQYRSRSRVPGFIRDLAGLAVLALLCYLLFWVLALAMEGPQP